VNVAELIEILSHEDHTSMVVIGGYEGGFTEVLGKERITILPSQHKEWWYGEHENTCSSDAHGIHAICIVGKRSVKHESG
jgi:hypothetical protein